MELLWQLQVWLYLMDHNKDYQRWEILDQIIKEYNKKGQKNQKNN